MGRHSEMETLVDRTQASPEARQRAKVMLSTLARDVSVKDACHQLGVGRTRLQDMRRRMLEFACGSLEPRAPGRPRSRPMADPQVEAELRRENTMLRQRILRLEAQLDIARSAASETVEARLLAKGLRR